MKLWEKVNPVGRPRRFKTPKLLWEACCRYFEDVEKNPLHETKAFCYQGEVTKTTIPKMRAMTLKAMRLHVGISEKGWANYRERDEFVGVVLAVEEIIYTQKFEGASADLLNPNLIIRDLGLADKQDLQSTDGSMSPPKKIELVAKGLNDE